MKNKLIPINSRDEIIPMNLKPLQEEDIIRIPIIVNFKEVDGELYYQIREDNTLRKWKDYNHMNFNRKEK